MKNYSWIARRARRIETFYGLWAGRRMAIQLALEDWRAMYPKKNCGYGEIGKHSSFKPCR